MIRRNLTDFQQYKFDSILTAIDIREKDNEYFIGKGGYSSLTCALYSYLPLISVHDQMVVGKGGVEAQGEPSNMRTGCSLVKKVCLN
jgi:hypothetical protein